MKKAFDSRYGEYGGAFVPETLMPALHELEDAFLRFREDASAQSELSACLKTYCGRPTPLYRAGRFSEAIGLSRVYLKREDLNHTGAHKINNALGQMFLARKMGKTRIIAETGAGQHGVAAATAAALMGVKCCVYMGSEDIRRQSLNVFRMRLLGAEVIPVESGTRTLKDAMNEAIRDWVTNVESTYYVVGSAAGPHPYPAIVKHFQTVIGEETREQIIEAEGRLPDVVIACVGGGSNAIGIFAPFISEKNVQLIGVEAAGEGLNTLRHSAPIAGGVRGILHGSLQYLMSDTDGQIMPTHSVAAGLDYPGVGPEHCHLHDIGRAEYVAADDQEALNAFEVLSRMEGIIPALESSHALGWLIREAERFKAEDVIVVNLSGRGDKDAVEVAQIRGESL